MNSTFIYTPGDAKSHKKLGEQLSALPKGKGDFVITWKRNRPVRSLSANKYYHAILNIIAIDTGHTHEHLHEYCKHNFMPKQEITFELGDTSEEKISKWVAKKLIGDPMIPKSTTDLDSKEFAAYINRVKFWAAERLEIYIPESKDIDHQKWIEIEDNYEKLISGF